MGEIIVIMYQYAIVMLFIFFSFCFSLVAGREQVEDDGGRGGGTKYTKRVFPLGGGLSRRSSRRRKCGG